MRQIENEVLEKIRKSLRLPTLPNNIAAKKKGPGGVSGSTTGRLLLDPFLWEWKYFVLGIATAGVFGILFNVFGFTGLPLAAPGASLLAGLAAVWIFYWKLRKNYVDAHKENVAFAAAKKFRSFPNFESYRNDLRRLFNFLSLTSTPLFAGISLGIFHLFPGKLSPQTILFIAAVAALVVNTTHHFGNNLLFKLGRWRGWVKVPGSAGSVGVSQHFDSLLLPEPFGFPIYIPLQWASWVLTATSSLACRVL